MKKQLRTLTKLLAAVIACCLSVAVHAQTTVRGTVTDADGMPLVGATVIVITGTQSGGGTTTDANGKFAIAAAPGQRLSVSYIGYKETSVEVTTKTDYDIRLESDNAQIDEVIVVGYGTQKKVNVTGSVATIDSKAFDKRPIVSTSANISGEATPVGLQDVAKEIVDGVDFVVNPRFEGKPTRKASSIIAFGEGGEVKIIRE